MADFLTSNEWYWRLARTVVEGVLGVLVANLDLIVGLTPLSSGTRALVVAIVAAVVSPVLAALGAEEGAAGDFYDGEDSGGGEDADAGTDEGGE